MAKEKKEHTEEQLEKQNKERLKKKEAVKKEAIERVKKSTSPIEIEEILFQESLNEGKMSSRIIIKTTDDEIDIPYNFSINTKSNTVDVTKRSFISSRYSLFDHSAKPSYYNKELLFALNKDEQERAIHLFDAFGGKAFLYLEDTGKDLVLKNVDTKVIPLKYEFKHETLSGKTHLPKRDQATEKELTGIILASEKMALLGILDRPSFADYLFDKEYAESKYIENPDDIKAQLGLSDAPLSFAIKHKKELDLSSTEERALKKVKHANPLFIDYSSYNGKILEDISKDIKFDTRSFYSDDEKCQILSKADLDGDLLKHHDNHKVLSALLEAVNGKNADFDFFGKEGKTASNSISRVSSSEDFRKEMSATNTNKRGAFFYKFDNEESLEEALMEGGSPSFPAMIDNKLYMISKPAYSTTSIPRLDEVKKSIERIKEKAKQNDGFYINAEYSKHDFNAICETLAYAVKLTGLGVTLKLEDILKDIIGKESFLVPNIFDNQTIIEEQELQSFLSNFTAFDANERIFPNIVNVEAKNLSFQELIKNTFLLERYLQMPGVCDVIKNIARSKEITLQKTKPFICSVTNPKMHQLKDEDKYIEINVNNPSGVFDFRYVPKIFTISSERDKKKMHELIMKATYRAFKPGENFDKMSEVLEDNLKKGKYIVIKSDRVLRDNLIPSEERLVILDENLNELLAPKTPAYNFINLLREENIIKKTDRARSAITRVSDMNQLFDSVISSMREDIALDSEFYSRVAKVYKSTIEKENIARASKKHNYGKPSFLRERSNKIFSHIRNNGIDQAVKEMFVNPIDSPKKMVENAIAHGEVGYEKAVMFLEKFYTGKEYAYADKSMISDRKEAMKRFIYQGVPDEIIPNEKKEEKISTIYGLMMEGSKADISVITGAMSLINNYAFISYIDVLSKNGTEEISVEHKRSLFISYMMDVHGLRDKQAEEVFGILSLYLAGDITRVAELIEMRWGKTRVVGLLLNIMATFDAEKFSNLKNILDGKIEKKKEKGENISSVSLFFIQGKNESDIIMQFYEMNPSIIRHHMSVIGKQKVFKIKNNKYPLALTDFVFLNLPVSLRSSKLIRNPNPSSDLSPSEYLDATYQKDTVSILNAVSNMSDIEFQALIAKNRDLIDNISPFFDNIPKMSNTQNIAKTAYVYILKIIKDGALEAPTRNKNVDKVLTQVLTKFWKEYSLELEKRNSRKHEVILVGKQHIETILDSSEMTQKLKAENLKTNIFTSFDVEQIEIDRQDLFKEKTFTSMREEEKAEIQTDLKSNVSENFIHCVSLPDDLFGKEEKVILPRIQFSKIAEQKGRVIEKDAHAYVSRMKKFAGETIESFIDTFLFDECAIGEEEIDEDMHGKIQLAINSFKIKYGKEAFENLGNVSEVPLPYLKYKEEEQKGMLFDLAGLISQLFETLFNEIPEEYHSIMKIEEKSFTRKLAKQLSNSAYKATVSTLYYPKDKTRAIKERLSFLIENKGSLVDDTALTVYLREMPEVYLFPDKHGKSTDEWKKEEIKGLRWIGEDLKKEDPSESSKENIFPSSSTLIFGSRGMIVNIDEMKDKELNNFNQTKKEHQTNLTSSTIYMVNGKTINHIAAIGTDESQQNTSAKKLKTFRLLDNMGRGDNKKLTITASGSWASKIETTAATISQAASESQGANVSEIKKNLIKNCSNFKLQNNTLSFLITRGEKDPIFDELMENALKSSISTMYAMGNKTNIMNAVDTFVAEIFSNPKTNLQKRIFEEEEGINLTKHDMIEEFEDILRSVSSSIIREAKKEVTENTKDKRAEASSGFGQSKSEAIKEIRDAEFSKILKEIKLGITILKKEISSMATPTSGSCNYIAMPSIAEQLEDAYLSVKSNDASYTILDDFTPSELKEKRLTQAKPSTFTTNIMVHSNLFKKYKTGFSIDGIFNTYMGLVNLAIMGIRAHSQDIVGMKTSEFNLVASRETKANHNSLIDSITNLIKKEVPIPSHHEEIAKKVFESVNHLIKNNATIQGLRRTLDEDETAHLEFLDGYNIEVSPKDLKKITLIHKTGYTNSIIEPYKEEPIGKKDSIITLGMNGIHFGHKSKLPKDFAPEGLSKLQYRTNIKIKPFDSLPSIAFSMNFSLDSDYELLEILSVANETKNMIKNHINNGENTREMTERVAATKLGLLCTIQACLDRDNQDEVQHILVNAENSEMGDFYHNIIASTTIMKMLEESNIQIKSFNPDTINEDHINGITSRFEQLHIVANAETVGAGKDLSAVDVGFYIGTHSNREVYAQSVARQIGNGKTESRYYLFNNHVIQKISAPLITDTSAYAGVYKIAINGLSAGVTASDDMSAATLISGKHFPLNMDKALLNHNSETVLKNKHTDKDFKSYRVISTGEVPPEDYSGLEVEDYKRKVEELNAVRPIGEEEIIVAAAKKAAPIPITPSVPTPSSPATSPGAL